MASAPVHSESDYDATVPPSSPQEQTSEDDGIPGPSRARHTGSQRSPSVDSSSVPSEPSEKSGEVESDNGDNGDIWTVEALMSERSVDDSGESEVSQRSPSVDENTTTTVQHKTWVGSTFMRMLYSVGSLQSGDNEVPWKWPLPNNAPPVVMTGWNSASSFVTRMQAGGSVSILSDDAVPYRPEVRQTKARGQTTTRSKDSSAKARTSSAPTRHKTAKRSGSRASTAVKGKKKQETEDVGSVFLQELADKAKAAVELIAHWVRAL